MKKEILEHIEDLHNFGFDEWFTDGFEPGTYKMDESTEYLRAKFELQFVEDGEYCYSTGCRVVKLWWLGRPITDNEIEKAFESAVNNYIPAEGYELPDYDARKFDEMWSGRMGY